MPRRGGDRAVVICPGPALALAGFYRRVALGVVGSTNDEALRLAAEGAEEGTLVTARSQTRGRGRRGRSWHSPEGNLYLSMVLRPPESSLAAVAIGFGAALAAAETVADLRPEAEPVTLKWPNDVLLGGRKVAGVLVEAAASESAGALVLGVGINLATAPADTPYPAAALAKRGARAPSVDAALAAFCAHFLARYRQWREAGFEPLRRDWLARAHGLGGPLTIDIEGRRFDGTFQGMDGSGALCLDLGAGRVKRITAGDAGFPAATESPPC